MLLVPVQSQTAAGFCSFALSLFVGLFVGLLVWFKFLSLPPAQMDAVCKRGSIQTAKGTMFCEDSKSGVVKQ